ncbi:MAG: hypothetical protein HZB71_12830 [Betaproteobacteria bacterium]|nr:hypothetical protein [Betaproteobacteria bacterium]
MALYLSHQRTFRVHARHDQRRPGGGLINLMHRPARKAARRMQTSGHA